MLKPLLIASPLLLAAAFCAPAPTDTSKTGPPPPPGGFVDERYPAGLAGEPGWEHAFSARADLNGDGEEETVVLVANVSLVGGEPAWDDGQVWHAYVERPDGGRLVLYRQYVQHGQVALALSPRVGGVGHTVLLTETTPHRLRVIETLYEGPDGQRSQTEVLLARDVSVSPQPLRLGR